MTELEILAELKIAYMELEDILENQDEQLTTDEYAGIIKSMENFKKVYNNLYKRIEKENKNILYFKDDLLIADEIYLDYVTDSKDYDDQYITYKDIENEEKWWEDYDFLDN